MDTSRSSSSEPAAAACAGQLALSNRTDFHIVLLAAVAGFGAFGTMLRSVLCFFLLFFLCSLCARARRNRTSLVDYWTRACETFQSDICKETQWRYAGCDKRLFERCETHFEHRHYGDESRFVPYSSYDEFVLLVVVAVSRISNHRFYTSSTLDCVDYQACQSICSLDAQIQSQGYQAQHHY